MSDEAKKIVASVNKGVLPPISKQPKNSNPGIDTSTRGLDRTTFGLQKIAEHLNRKND
jgi:hypothetical protein